MNYIWDILIKAEEQGIRKSDIKFKNADICSPYMETSFSCLNTSFLNKDIPIEVNPCYRYFKIFRELFDINLQEDKEIRDVLLDILLHFLGELDLKSGIVKEEFIKLFLLRDIENRVYGHELAENIKEFEKRELDTILNGILTLSKAGSSLFLFTKIIKNIFNSSIVYMNKNINKTLYIYLGVEKTKENISRISTVINTFLPINVSVKLFWDIHFGIIGIEDTMMINEIVVVE